MDVRYALAVLWPRTWVLIACGTVATVTAFVATGFVTPAFESRATLLVGQSSGAPPLVYEDLLTAQILSTTYAALGTTAPVLAEAQIESGISISVDELRDGVRVEASRNSPLIVVTATFPTADAAARVANAVAQAIAAIGSREGESLQLSVVDPAQPAEQPISPRPLISAVVAGGVGVLASAGSILAFARLRSTRRRATSDPRDRSPAVGEAR